jgi:hypothetical protein
LDIDKSIRKLTSIALNLLSGNSALTPEALNEVSTLKKNIDAEFAALTRVK